MSRLLLLLLLPLLLSSALLVTADQEVPHEAASTGTGTSTSTSTSSCSVGKRDTVNAAMNELFTCLLVVHVEPTEAYRLASRVNFRGIAGSGVIQGPLLTGTYSVAKLSAESESYRRYYQIADMFTIELGIDEVRGPAELGKLDGYLDFLERSPFVRDTHATLLANAAIEAGTSLRSFVRGHLYNQWFKQYARTAKAHERGLRESSGFGHVFVGEVKTNEVTGFHNWLQLLLAEETGQFEYQGYVRVLSSPVVVGGIQFRWLGRPKPLSSVMVGVPPEFELAIYSACFVANAGRKTNLSIKGKQVSVQTHYVNHQPESVATAYPVV